MGEVELNEDAARAQVAALAIDDDAGRRRAICELVGHSRVVNDVEDGPKNAVTCARCGVKVDAQTQRFDAPKAVFRRHIAEANCIICMKNLQDLTWWDLWEVQLGAALRAKEEG